MNNADKGVMFTIIGCLSVGFVHNLDVFYNIAIGFSFGGAFFYLIGSRYL